MAANQQEQQQESLRIRAQVVVGVIENRAKEVGVAAFDMRTASLHLSQYIETSRSYMSTLTLLHFFDPTEIIVPPTGAAPHGIATVVARFTQNQARKIVLTRGCFDDTKGAMIIKNIAAKEPSVLDAYYKQYYLCLGAAAAVIKWIENEKGVLVTNHSLLVTFNGSADHMSIDSTSVQNLEVIEPLLPAKRSVNRKYSSLFRLMNTTKTIGGSRLLRANLLQPLKDAVTINTRLDCLEDMLTNEKLFFGLSKVLQKFPKDIDRILCHFCFRQKRIMVSLSDSSNEKRSQTLISSVLLLKQAIEVLPALTEVLKLGKCMLLSDIREAICENPRFSILLKSIAGVIDDDILHARAPFVARTQQCFALKPGIDGLLDIARKAFCETSEAIHSLAKKYRDTTGFLSLKMPFNSRRGFMISIPEKDTHEERLPKIFIQVTKQGKHIHCSTQELISLNMRNKEAAAECYRRTENCLEGIIDKIRDDAVLLTVLAESISLLDMIVNSFAYMVSSKDIETSRPEFTDDGPLAIEAGRHPVVEVLHPEAFVPNNTFLSEASNMILVTGPNMSGKSTYLRQVALITILAHIGSYVPARFASFRVLDHIFTRIASGDNFECNSSTFMMEMKETAFILDNVTPRSLVLLDELGKATSSVDGLAIAWSCCEHLLSLRAYTIFATHMQRLVELSSLYPNVKACHFQVDIANNRLDFKEGHADVPHYGLLLLEAAGFPCETVKRAKEIAEKLNTQEVVRMNKGYSSSFPLRKEYHCVQRLLCLKYANLSEENLRNYLQNLKDSYIPTENSRR